MKHIDEHLEDCIYFQETMREQHGFSLGKRYPGVDEVFFLVLGVVDVVHQPTYLEHRSEVSNWYYVDVIKQPDRWILSISRMYTRFRI